MNKEKILTISIIIISILLLILNFWFFPKKSTKKFTLKDEIPVAYKNQNPYLKPKEKQEKQEKIPSVISDKTIYLTFDDGPTHLTNQILDILSKENVVATFFVIGNHFEEYKNVVKKAHNDGHTIAIHSNTHNYGEIYSSDENYFTDLKTINDKIYSVTGHHSHIVRLPGGSSNTVSKKYNQGIVTRITNQLNKDNYYYFDWNVDSGDASGSLSKDQIYQNTTRYLHDGTNIVLMHDAANKKTTVEALSDIIKYAKDNGYTFAKITKNTVPIRHSVNN